MKAILRLECIGDDTYQKLRKFSCIERAAGAQASVAPPQWVAEIKGTGGKYGIEREFMMAKKDYSQANSVGSRGIYAEYYLETGRYYEVNQQHTNLTPSLDSLIHNKMEHNC
jgi:hypothetical protein